MNKEILKLAIPNILTNLSVPLVSLVDLALMGRMPSSNYIVAIGFGTVIFNLIYWAFGFLRMGTTGMVSQAFGKGDQERSYQLLVKGFVVSLLAGLLLILSQYPIKEIAISLINPEVTVIAPLVTYFDIRIWAAPATISIYVISGWLLGMQDAKSAMVLAITVNLLNAILSYYFVYSSHLSIKGVALGTILAQYIGLIIGLFILIKKYRFHQLNLKLKELLKASDWREFIFVNGHIFIRTLCLIFVMSFFKTKAGNIDPIVGAANILLIEFITLSAYGIDGFAFAAESLCGKYFGLHKRDLFIKSVKTSFSWGIGISIIIAIVFLSQGKAILQLLTDKEFIIDAALPYLPWLALAPLINGIAFIWDGIYIGTTAVKAMRDTLILSTILVFLPSYFLFKDIFGNHGIWLSITLFMLSRGLIQTFLAQKVIFNRID